MSSAIVLQLLLWGQLTSLIITVSSKRMNDKEGRHLKNVDGVEDDGESAAGLLQAEHGQQQHERLEGARLLHG